MKTCFTALISFALLVFLSSCVGGKDTAWLAPYDLRIGPNFKDPLGYSLEDMSVSWKIPFRPGAKQSAYRIQVFDRSGALAEDTGKVVSPQSSRVKNPLDKVDSRGRYTWRVKIWDENGKEGPWSEPASFEAGLLRNSDWLGKWISTDKQSKSLYTFKYKGKILERKGFAPACLRKSFTAKKPVSARLYVASKGIFQIYINGKKVGRDFWGTGWTNPEIRIQTNTYDVASMINDGENAIAAVVADGWYSGRIAEREGRDTGKKPALLAQLEIFYQDGSKQTVLTDGTWKTSTNGFVYADIYDGESFDARGYDKNWKDISFDDSKWGSVAVSPLMDKPLLQPRRNQPIVVKQVLNPVSVTKRGDGVFQFDFGQNMTGVPKITFKGRRGDTAKIRYAEMLQKDGSLYTDNYRSAVSTDYYKFASENFETFAPIYTFHGYRYVEISGLPSDAKAEDISIKSLVMYNDMPESGKFSCDNALVNKLQSNIVWGQRSNYFSVPTDCPQRDERMGWLGDAQVFVPTAAFNMDVNAFFDKWMFDVFDCQRADGNLPHVAPGQWGFGSPAWSDAGVICTYQMYLSYGDVDILRCHYESMAKWIGYLCLETKNRNFIREDTGFGDWLQPSTTHSSSSKYWRGATPRPLIGTAYFYKCAKIMERVAGVLGRSADAKKYAKLADDISKAFVDKFVKPDGTVATNTQTGYLLALDFDILPQSLREKAFKKFLEKFAADGYTLDTGFVGTPLIAPVLTRFGRHDLAVGLLLSQKYPSWLFTVRQGATTMWERWNSYSHDKGFGEASMNSFNHYAYGAVGDWMYGTIGGIALDAENPGYKNIVYRAIPTKKIKSASASYDTPYGTAESKWSISDDGTMKWRLRVPANAQGRIILPANSTDIEVNGKPTKKLVLEKMPCGDYDIAAKVIKF